MRLVRVLLVAIGLAIIASFFIPYFSSTEEGKALAEIGSDIKPFETVDMTAKDLENPSLFTYTKVYFQGGQEIFHDSVSGTVYAILYCLVPVFGLLIFLFGATGKGIPALIFSVLLGADAFLIRKDFVMRGVTPSNTITDGIGYYMIYACAALGLILSICLIVTKSKAKRA